MTTAGTIPTSSICSYVLNKSAVYQKNENLSSTPASLNVTRQDDTNTATIIRPVMILLSLISVPTLRISYITQSFFS